MALPSDHNRLLTCQGQVEEFPRHISSFILNVTCKYEDIRSFFI